MFARAYFIRSEDGKYIYTCVWKWWMWKDERQNGMQGKKERRKCDSSLYVQTVWLDQFYLREQLLMLQKMNVHLFCVCLCVNMWECVIRDERAIFFSLAHSHKVAQHVRISLAITSRENELNTKSVLLQQRKLRWKRPTTISDTNTNTERHTRKLASAVR